MRYYPPLNLHTGSVNGTLFFLQVLYWYDKEQKPFYKFQNPSMHVLYKPGDSWTEELGFSESQLKSVLRRTATRLRNGRVYDLRACKLVLYWSIGNGLNHYTPNYPALLSLGETTDFLKSKFPHFQKWKSDFSKVEKDLFHIRFSHPQKFDLAFSYIQEITQTTTNNYSKKERSSLFEEKNEKAAESVIFPFHSATFKNTWVAWKNYKRKNHQFVYTEESEQAALLSLSVYDEDYALQLIRNAIANGWKNFHFENTAEKYQQLKNSKHNGNHTTRSEGNPEPHIAAIFKKYST